MGGRDGRGHDLGVHGGTWYFSATGGPHPAILEQTVDLMAQGFTAAELDAGARSMPAAGA